MGTPASPSALLKWFQSSPGPGAECNAWRSRRTWAATCFNPHPARGPSATYTPSGSMEFRCQFQSSPGPGAECNVHAVRLDGVPLPVSILTRPGGRVQHLGWSIGGAVVAGSFNPHPARGPSATLWWMLRRPYYSRFNPHPARGPSATRWRRFPGTSDGSGFNPHPARGPSATGHRNLLPSRPRSCFNPHPARGPSATPIPVFSTCSPRTSSTMAKGEHILFNLTGGFKHGRSMDANPQLGSAVAMGSRYAKRGPVKSTTLLWPYSSTRLSRPSGSL